MEKFKFLPKEKISSLPKESGVYCFKENKEILYIGKAGNLRERVKNHFQQPSYRDYLFLDKVKKVGYIKTNSEIEALILEANLIKKYQPKYNVLWKDDKNYFFVGVSKEPFPRVFITHQPLSSNLYDREKRKIEYIGPFVDGKALKQTLKILRKVFPYRSCSKIPKRPCLWYHLNYCLGPCLLQSETMKEISFQSTKIQKLSQKNVKNLVRVLKKGWGSIIKELKREMKLSAKNQEFEEAARIRDQIKALEKIMAHAKVFEVETEDRQWSEKEKMLKEILKTKRKISRIEAYDVSQIHGSFAVGAMVTFVDGRAEKSFYRRFKIKFTKIPSDVHMLKEVVKRRLGHREWGVPDLFLVDGGKAQLQAVISVKSKFPGFKKTKVIALAKKENKLFIEGKKESISLKELPRAIFNLILQLRDEAHRFAISYHKKLREKSLI